MQALRFAAACLVLPVICTAAAAQGADRRADGPYVALGAGLNHRAANELNGGGTRETTAWGPVVVGAIGWRFENGLRLELEGSHRRNDVETARRNGTPASAVSGGYEQYGVMANLLFEPDLGLALGGVAIRPYLGGGIGYLRVDAANAVARFNPGLTVRADGSDNVLAGQAIAGVAFGLDPLLPGLTLTAEYRFLGTESPRLSVVGTSNGRSPVSVTTLIEPANTNHSVLLGLRYVLGGAPAAPPAAPPAAAPAPARSFLVFFDWNSDALGERARRIVAEAAASANAARPSRIEVAGHADRTGGAAFNAALSRRRAEAVAAELVRLGLRREEIAVQGFGFERPLVPTADGVREPQNRRVEIVLR